MDSGSEARKVVRTTFEGFKSRTARRWTGTLTRVRHSHYISSGRRDSNPRRPAWERQAALPGTRKRRYQRGLRIASSARVCGLLAHFSSRRAVYTARISPRSSPFLASSKCWTVSASTRWNSPPRARLMAWQPCMGVSTLSC